MPITTVERRRPRQTRRQRRRLSSISSVVTITVVVVTMLRRWTRSTSSVLVVSWQPPPLPPRTATTRASVVVSACLQQRRRSSSSSSTLSHGTAGVQWGLIRRPHPSVYSRRGGTSLFFYRHQYTNDRNQSSNTNKSSYTSSSSSSSSSKKRNSKTAVNAKTPLPPELSFLDEHHDESWSPIPQQPPPPEIIEFQQFTTTVTELKLQHLLKDLNPSQVEAVTQPVVDLRHRYDHHDNDADLQLLDDSPPPLSFDDATPQNSAAAVITRVIAGPGSGKTKVLTTRIAYLLQQQQQQQQTTSGGFHRNMGNVLAVTFTRKAAGEMRERLERLLRELQDIETTQQQQEDDDDDDDAIRLDRHGNIIEEFVNGEATGDGAAVTLPEGLERVELGTFHSICAKIMRYNGELLQSLPSVHRDMSHASPIVVKRSRTTDEDDDDNDDDHAATPSIPEVLEIPQVNLNGQFAIADQSEQLRILKECMAECDISLKDSSVKPIQILNTIADMKQQFAQGKDPFFQERGKPPGTAMKSARQVYYRYREKLLSNNAVDFDDLILMTRELLMENEDLRQRLHKRWPHVLVDEFQDSSKTQLDLVKLLTSSTLLVVGDSDQSIYSWRGAHVGSLHDVKQDFASYGDVHTVFLKDNYRSTPNIIRAAERVISTNDGSGKVDDLRQSMKPNREVGKSPRIVACDDEESEASFVVDTILKMIDEKELAQTGSVAIIYRTNAQSRHLEEACVSKGLPYVIRGGAGGFYNRAEIKDCLCFLRWIYNGNDIGSMLRAMKTPSKGIGDKGMKEFQTYCDILQRYFVENVPHLKRPTPLDVLISMSGGGDAVGGSGITKAGDFWLPPGAPFAEDHISKRALKNFLAFSSKMRDFRIQAHEKSVEKLLFYITEELDLMSHFDAMSKSKAEFSDRQSNVQELRQAAKKYGDAGSALSVGVEGDPFDGASESGLTRFLDDVALVSDLAEAADEKAKGEEKLVANLMTIHASKGMEFDAVFVVGVEEGTLPCSPALKDDATSVQLEEERRLCYVAMTRAKTHLIMTWRKEVTSFSDWSSSGPKTIEKVRSRFLDPLVSRKGKKKGPGKVAGGTAKPSTPQNQAQGLYGPPSNGRAFSSVPPSRVERNGVRGTSSAAPPSTFDSLLEPARPPKKRLVKKKRVSPKMAVKKVVQKIPSNAGVSSSPQSVVRTGSGAPSKSSLPKEKIRAAPSSSSRALSKNDRPLPTSIDPTWFFPVGEAVLHRNLGRGVVMGHTPADAIDETQIQVEFEDGKVLEFPALGSDIVPDLGSR